MKLIGLGFMVAATGLGVAITNRADLVHARVDDGALRGCFVGMAPGHLPRAELTVINRRGDAIRIWLEARSSSTAPRADVGAVGAFAERTFPHALPAGRNALIAARADDPKSAARQLFYVANRGAETCARRYVWRVE